ncbi:MAG: hypothetical protein ABIJ48_07375 [Actinomycetota bacterium]
MRRRLTAVAVLALLLGGCGGEDDPSTSSAIAPTTTTEATSTTAVTSTTAAPPTSVVTTTTGGRRAFAVGTPGLYPPDPLPDSGGANGSGCPPEAGPLPDGIWFGRLLEVSPTSARFDPGCFYFGEVADEQAELDGITDLPSPHYLRNPLPDLIDLGVAEGAVVYSIDNSVDPLGFLTLSVEEWPATHGGYTLCPGEYCTVWLYVNGGRVTEILEQYLP